MLKSFLTSCLLVVFASTAYSQMNGPMAGKRGMHQRNMGMCSMCVMGGAGDMMDGMMGNCLTDADKIGLSKEQVGKITPIHREMEKKRVQSQADIRIAQIDLEGIMAVKDFDLEKAEAQVKKIEDIRTACHLDMLKSLKEVRSIFTEEQFKKLKQLMQSNMKEAKPPRRMMKKRMQQ